MMVVVFAEVEVLIVHLTQRFIHEALGSPVCVDGVAPCTTVIFGIFHLSTVLT